MTHQEFINFVSGECEAHPQRLFGQAYVNDLMAISKSVVTADHIPGVENSTKYFHTETDLLAWYLRGFKQGSVVVFLERWYRSRVSTPAFRKLIDPLIDLREETIRKLHTVDGYVESYRVTLATIGCSDGPIVFEASKRKYLS